MADGFTNFERGLSDPAEHAAAVTPHDTNDLANTTLGLWVGTGGNVKVDMAGGGSAVVFTAVPNGTLLRIRVTRVYNSDTTASNIVALY